MKSERWRGKITEEHVEFYSECKCEIKEEFSMGRWHDPVCIVLAAEEDWIEDEGWESGARLGREIIYCRKLDKQC